MERTNEHRKRGAQNTRGSATQQRFGFEKQSSNSKENFSGTSDKKFMVPEDVQYDISVHLVNTFEFLFVGLPYTYIMIRIKFSVLFETRTLGRSNSKTENQMDDLRFQELSCLYGQLSWVYSPWKSRTLLREDICEQFRALVYVFSNSVLCLDGKCPQYPESAKVWAQDRHGYFVSTPEYRQYDNLDGEPFVFECKIFQGTQQRSFSTRSKI